MVPLRFSILALLTARKCTVFDDSLIQLMAYIRDLPFEDVHIYKLALTGPQPEDGTRSPTGEKSSSSASSIEDSDGSAGTGSPKEEVKTSFDTEAIKLPIPSKKIFVDGNERYLQSERYQYQVSLVCFIIDEMATEPVIRPQPPGFKDILRVQQTILDRFRKKLHGEEFAHV